MLTFYREREGGKERESAVTSVHRFLIVARLIGCCISLDTAKESNWKGEEFPENVAGNCTNTH